MVNPLYLIIISLLAGFSLPLIDKASRKLSFAAFLGVAGANLTIVGSWIYKFIISGAEEYVVNTAGFLAPLSINFHLGYEELIVLFGVNLIAFFTAIYLGEDLQDKSISSMILYLMIIMGVNGLILTRDLFNAFVFMEIVSISTIALITLGRRENSLVSGFKYMLASGIASILFLLGVVFIYFYSGSLNIDFINYSFTGYKLIAVYMIAISLLIELKSFPANGWALDVYESTNPIIPNRYKKLAGIRGMIL